MPTPDSLARHKAGLLHFISDYDNMAKASLSEGSMDGKTTVKYLQDYIKSYDDDYKDAKAVIHMLCDIVAKGDEVYAIYLPADAENTLPSSETIHTGGKVNDILFNGQKLNFTQNGNEVHVTFPEQYDKEPAYVLTIHKI